MDAKMRMCAVLGLALLATPALLAQAASAPASGPMGPRAWGGMRGVFRFGKPVTGAPYTAVRTTTHEQTLANGTTISRVTTVNEARDSEGRTYRETAVERGGHSFVSYRVFDPVSRVSLAWNSESKQAIRMHLPDPGQFQNAHPRRQGANMGPGRGLGFHRAGAAPAVENLGSKTIAGVAADGTRRTLVIPAGQQGNSQPLTVTHESWYNSDLQLVVERIDNDPRTGTTTTELTNIDRNEPQPEMFQVPEGYTIQDRGRGFQAMTPAPDAPGNAQ